MKHHGLAFYFFFLVGSALAQQPQTGFPPYGTFQDGQFDAVNLENLNVNFSIPIVTSPGRGIGFKASIHFNSLIWYPSAGLYAQWYWSTPYDISGYTWGWTLDPTPWVTYATETGLWCGETYPEFWRFFNYQLIEPDGTRHDFGMEWYDGVPDVPACEVFRGWARAGHADDGSGYYIDHNNWGALAAYSPAGIKFTEDHAITDTNGNRITVTFSPGERDFTDTLGRVVLRIRYGANYRDYQVLDANGNYQTIRLNFQSSFQIRTNFACTGIEDWTYNPPGGYSLPVSIVLPNNLSYWFEYEDTPGFPGYTTGRLKKVTLPTGGSYEYLYPGPNGGMDCTSRTLARMTRRINDGTSTAEWQYTRTQTESTPERSTWKTLATAPQLPYDSAPNESAYFFTKLYTSPPRKETSEKHYRGREVSNQLLRTVNTTFACGLTGSNCKPTAQTVILENNQQSRMETDIDLWLGILREKREYHWGTGSPGPLARKTTYSYLSGSAYTSRNINRVTQVLVRDGAGAIKSRTDMEYDSTPLTCVPQTTPPIPQHYRASYGCDFTFRGNLTKATQYLTPAADPPTGPIAQTFVYDVLGNLRSTTDPGGHTTSFAYDDDYSDGVNRNTFAYLTRTTKPAPFSSQTLTSKYFFPIGQPSSTTDENSRTTSFSYRDELGNPDPFNRLRKTSFPDGGETTISYDDINRRVTTTQKRTATASVAATEVYNPLGLLVQTQLPGGRKVDVTYDPLGRAWKESNPYVTAGEPTAGEVETQYDALGRVTRVVKQDGKVVQSEYAGNATRVTDETGKQRLAETDALGRATKVCEVTAGNTRSPAESCGITSFGGGTGYLTTNTYDVLDNLTQVTQGAQTRILNYDALGRLTSARIPEISPTANVTYGYDNDSLRTSVTDPRGTVNFEYDELHRLRKKKHGATVVAEFVYDGTQANNAIGRLIAEWDGPAGTADKTDYTYDTLGRALTANRTVSGTTYAMAYSYDYLGGLTSLNYPSSSGTRRLVEYGYNAAAELDKVTDATNPAARFDYVTGSQYAPLGALAQVDLGNGVRTMLGWHRRSWLTSLLAQKVGGSTHLNLAYTYFDNGQVQQITDALNNLKSEKYTYDSLQRLFTAQRGPDASIQRKYEYDYDRYGNRWEQTVVAGGGYGGSFSFDTANNRITSTGFAYDGSGNLTANGPLTSYTYNQENFLTAAGTTTYLYDAQGRRVRKTVGNSVTDYFYSGSEVIAEKQDTIWTDSIFFGDQRVAQQTGATASTAIYLHPDHLGSTRVCTDANGLNNNGNWTCDYEPFGEIQPGSTCAVPTNYGFAGAEYDPETGLYHFWFRQYDPNQGRWMSVDPVPGSPDDPQSLNRYPYVRNAPVNFTDPLGLSHEPWLLEYEVPHDADPQSETLRQLYGLPPSAIRCSLDGISISCGHLLGMSRHAVALAFLSVGSDVRFSLPQQVGRGRLVGIGVHNQLVLQIPEALVAALLEGKLVALGLYFKTVSVPFRAEPLDPSWLRARAVLGEAYQRSRAVTDPRTIAAWYAASALAGGAGLAYVTYGPALVQFGKGVFLNPVAMQNAVDFLSSFGPTVPAATLGGLSGFALQTATRIYDWYQRRR